MAVGSKLKVYRTPIGFHDAYVAAPSQKAALKAWGSEHDLFGRGVAEIVTDPALSEEPLSRPGIVVKRWRGTAAEQIAARPPGRPSAAVKKPQSLGQPKPKPKPKPKPAPPPDRTALDNATSALSQAGARQRDEDRALRKQESELERRRQAQDKAHAAEIARLTKALEAARAAFDRAVKAWRG